MAFEYLQEWRAQIVSGRPVRVLKKFKNFSLKQKFLGCCIMNKEILNQLNMFINQQTSYNKASAHMLVANSFPRELLNMHILLSIVCLKACMFVLMAFPNGKYFGLTSTSTFQ